MVKTNNNQRLADNIREILAERSDVEERHIFNSIHFMVDEKMCVCVMGDEMMCRISAEEHAIAIEQTGCRTLVIGKKAVKNFVLVDESVLRSRKDFSHWIDLCLAFNPEAKASKKKKNL